MKHLTSILLLTLAIGLIGHAAPITGKVTGEAVIELPDDPRLTKIDDLERRVKQLERDRDEIRKQLAAILNAPVMVGELKTLKDFIGK